MDGTHALTAGGQAFLKIKFDFVRSRFASKCVYECVSSQFSEGFLCNSEGLH